MTRLVLLLLFACGKPAVEIDKWESLRRSCDGGRLEDCVELGIHVSSGYPLKAGTKDGIALLERACDGGVAKGCRVLGLVLAVSTSEEDKKKAFAFAKRGCHQADGASCWILAKDYSRGSGVAPDFAEYQRLIRRACDLRWCTACSDVSPEAFKACR